MDLLPGEATPPSPGERSHQLASLAPQAPLPEHHLEQRLADRLLFQPVGEHPALTRFTPHHAGDGKLGSFFQKSARRLAPCNPNGHQAGLRIPLAGVEPGDREVGLIVRGRKADSVLELDRLEHERLAGEPVVLKQVGG
ncbi:MAG: hypothetical protein KatS3mg061_1337 [Dehalococcoidia bacterium]|nr:MAG: hypothetical protein KatS3mg061_1337 [Dehalococcoidia bacterium]